jgi:hypothetical protein
LTPAQQALLDEVRQFRESGEDVGFENSLYSLDFQNAPDWVQQGQYLGLQTKRGIPAYALQAEVEKARRQMPGLSYSAIRTGV